MTSVIPSRSPQQDCDPRRPRLLFLCQTLPYPPDGGVQIRSFNVMRELSKSFDITALCFFRAATRPLEQHVREGLEGLSEVSDPSAFAIPGEASRPRVIWDHVRSVVTQRVYTYYVYQSGRFASALQDALARHTFDLVHVDSLDLSCYLPALSDLPVICTHHNIESALLRSRARTEDNAIVANYLRLQARLMEAEERRWCGRFALNVTVSDEDARRLEEIAPGSRITVVPNGVDTSLFKPAPAATAGIVFVGGYGWYPNRDAMAYFAESILPLIRRHEAGVEATWVGRAPQHVQEEYDTRHSIDMTGYVDDIKPIVQRAACYVVPLRAGGGTRLKILDAWAMGKAVVSTSVGCEGLHARDGENILIRDEPDAFAEAVLQVLRSPGLRDRIGRNARRTAESDYDWGVIGKRMVGAYQSAMV